MMLVLNIQYTKAPYFGGSVSWTPTIYILNIFMYIYNNILLKQQNVFEKVVSAEEIESKVTILV